MNTLANAPSSSFFRDGLVHGQLLVALGALLLLIGYVSLSHPWVAGTLLLGFVSLVLWLFRSPRPRLSWRASLVAAVVAWIPLVGIYWWRASLAASMGPEWGTVWVLAPSYELVVSRTLTLVMLSSALAGVCLGVLGLLAWPWREHRFGARARRELFNSSTGCLGVCFAAFTVWVGRSLALMGLAG